MRRVLFVDDEPKLLDGLRRMLRVLRREWEMEFVASGRDALDCMKQRPFDVVVTDMRMPDMEGAELLRAVMQRHPATVRLILSGQCDRAAVLKTVGVVHQFLTKPCDSETLRNTIGKACLLRDRLADDWHKQMVSLVKSVPCMPDAYSDLIAEFESESPSMDRTCEIVAGDVGLATKVLQLVSTSFFGTPRRCSDPKTAVRLFDLETLRALAASNEVVHPFAETAFLSDLLRALTRHCRQVSRAAKAIAQAESNDPVLIDDAGLAGLIHDVGIFLLAEYAPEKYLNMLERSEDESISLWSAEKKYLNATHGDIGGYLAALWGLPPPIFDAIAWHHAPGQSDAAGFSPLTAVHVADYVMRTEVNACGSESGPLDREYLRAIGMEDRLPQWRELCLAAVASHEGVMG
jgi:HD-like signal output (HDOD) protein/CheY-like chemotaxis protein